MIKNRARDLALVALGLLIGIGLTLRADELPRWSLIGGYGQADYSRSGNGTWHQQQEGRETSGNTRPRTWEFGVGYRFGGDWSAWKAEILYERGGDMAMTSTAIAYPDDDASKHDPGIDVFRPACFKEPTPDCMTRVRGAGGVRGFDFLISRDLLRIGPAMISGGGGVFIYRAYWNAQMLPMDPACLGDDNKCQWRGAMNQKTDWLFSPTLRIKASVAIVKNTAFYIDAKRHFRTGQHAPITPGYTDSHRMITLGLEHTL